MVGLGVVFGCDGAPGGARFLLCGLSVLRLWGGGGGLPWCRAGLGGQVVAVGVVGVGGRGGWLVAGGRVVLAVRVACRR